MKTNKSGDETQLMPSPAQLTQGDASDINDTRKMPSPEELIAKEKAARVNVEYNYEMAYSAAGRHQAEAEALRQELKALKKHDQFREANYAFHMQDLGRLEAERDMLEEQLRKEQARPLPDKMLGEFYATIESNVNLQARNSELSAEKSALEIQLGEEANKREEEKLVIGSLAIAERRADNKAEALEKRLNAYEERYGDIDKPAPLPRPGYLARLYRIVARHMRAMEKLVYKREEK